MSNKEAIEKLKKISFMTGYKEALDLAIKALEEQPTGEWIEGTLGYYCSRCGMYGWFDDDFCPRCGAKMKGEEE